MEMATWAKHIPFMLRHTLHVASAELARLGGPDLLQDALAMIESGGVRLESSEEIVGKYGSHSELSLEASRLYDEESTILDPKTGARAKELWLCGHFAGKAFAELLRAERRKDQSDRTVLFWQTKSAMQPRLDGVDEWEVFRRDMPDKVKWWAEKGQAYSKLRVGAVDLEEADVEKAGYRGLMQPIDFSKL